MSRLTFHEAEARPPTDSGRWLPSNQVRHEELLVALYENIGLQSHMEDVDHTLRMYDAFTEKALARAAYVATRNRFQRWLIGERSDMLLIDGHCVEQVVDRVSPLSTFCATLISSIVDFPQSPGPRRRMVIYFFCGPHSLQYGYHNGPSALMSSLLIQLMTQWPQKD